MFNYVNHGLTRLKLFIMQLIHFEELAWILTRRLDRQNWFDPL